MMENIPLIAAAAGILGLVIAFVLYKKVTNVEITDSKVAEITQEIQDGAMAFLFAEYKVITVFVIVVAALLAFINDTNTAIAFFAGAIASVLAGFSGMRSATSANGRTAMAAKNGGQSAALEVSYNGGAVMGLSVGGLGLLGISLIAY
ncbi:MAG: sodium-translocating pyrophosphatase, partial [Euryarchaeota archaeon]|nr:sodium-translocating pyrophosphatase [Euryarchaeota archaeon]